MCYNVIASSENLRIYSYNGGKTTLRLKASECDRKLKNEVKNVLKFSNGKFEVESKGMVTHFKVLQSVVVNLTGSFGELTWKFY